MTVGASACAPTPQRVWGSRQRALHPPKAFDSRGGDMGIYFLALVVLLTFVYLGFALFRPEKF